MFWCHNRSLLNVYDVETVIITTPSVCLAWSIRLTMENMRRVLDWIGFDSIQLDELSQEFGESYTVCEVSTQHTAHTIYIFSLVHFFFGWEFSLLRFFRVCSIYHLSSVVLPSGGSAAKKWCVCCVCKYSISKHSIWTWNWTTVLSHNLRNVHVGKQI